MKFREDPFAPLHKETHEEYENRLFPLHEKEYVQKMLDDLLSDSRTEPYQKLFCYLSYKDSIYIIDEKQRNKAYGEWYYSALSRLFGKEEKSLIMALARLTREMAEDGLLPSAEDVKKRAEELNALPAPKKPFLSFRF